MRPGTERRERWVTADVPFLVIDVPFRPDVAASSGLLVSFFFIHTNDMPIFETFLGFPCAGKCFKTRSPIDRVNH
jgi:hypothetical protein